MNFLHNIKTVAHYEAKTLGRSWFFRLFALGALFVFTMMNIGIFSPVGGEDWEAMAIASALPHFSLYLLNIGQSIVVIFLAADFLKKDKKLDTNEVLYTRSMSNLEYVIGKMWGILRLFLGLNLVTLLIALIVNLTARSMSIDVAAYFSHLLLISVPTLIFSLGLAFLLMSIIKNQAVTFLLLLGYAALNMFYLNHKAGYIFDYMAFGLPMFKSSIIGYGNLFEIVAQRSIYLFGGLAMVAVTVLIFKRLPQSRTHRIATVISLVIFLVITAGASTASYKIYAGEIKEKTLAMETSLKYEDALFLTAENYQIELTHTGSLISAKAGITLINNNSENVGSVVLSLNPGLKVTGAKYNGTEVLYIREYNMLLLESGKVLQPGDTVFVSVEYEGTISETFCSPGKNPDPKNSPYRIAMVNVNKRQAFLSDEYVLLTPEAQWYPVATLNIFPTHPARLKSDFSYFNLLARTDSDLTVISQGRSESGNGEFNYITDTPIPGMTLIIGKYVQSTLTAGNIEYNAWVHPGHDYYKDDFKEIADTLTHIVSGIMTDLENNFSSTYPYERLNLVEVPVQFYSYPVMNSQKRAEVQPGIILLPEKLATINQAGFAREIKRQKKRFESNSQVVTDREVEIRLITNFMRTTFISGSTFNFSRGNIINEPTRYMLGPSFYLFRNNFYSDEYPVINAVFESHLQKVETPQRGMQSFLGGLAENDKANMLLKETSLQKILESSPGADTLRAVLSVKGDYLFNLMRSRAGIETFNKWFADYMKKNAFRRVSISEFDEALQGRFGFSITPFLEEWYSGTGQPGFLITSLRVDEVVVDDRSRFRITFDASNPEPTPGIFNISFRTGGPGMGGRGGGSMTITMGPGGGGSARISAQGRGMEATSIDRIVYLSGGQAKRISMILDQQPRAMMINTLFSKNIPGEITLPLTVTNKTGRENITIPDEIILDALPSFSESYEIIVDNEDSGFISSQVTSQSPMKKLLGIESKRSDSYEQMRMNFAPEHWQPIVQSTFYGKYARSASYTRAGTGDRSVEWNSVMPEPGYYEVYTYIGKSANRMAVRMGGPGGQGGGSQESEVIKDYHYIIKHDDGSDEVTLEYENAVDGWNSLGTFYLSADTARVVLTNKSAGRMVIADAVKWIKMN